MLQLATALGAMKILSDAAEADGLQSQGISSDDWDVTTGNRPWVGQERQRVTRTLDALMHGSMDIIGVQRFEAPAEYIAASIAMFVKPTNMMIACRWAEKQPSAQDIAAGAVVASEKVSANQLFSLVCELVGEDKTKQMQIQFDKRSNKKLLAAEKAGEPA